MAKAAKKTVKRTIEERLDSIEVIMGTILYIFANADIHVSDDKPAQKKVAKKMIKAAQK